MKGYNREDIKVRYIGVPMFYVNEKKGTVTCKVNATVIGPSKTDFPWNSEIEFPTKEISAEYTTRCHPDDTFDAERGKRIALARAENMLYAQASNHVSEVIRDLNDMLQACTKFAEKSVYCRAHNVDYVDSLTMPAHPKYKSGPMKAKSNMTEAVQTIKK